MNHLNLCILMLAHCKENKVYCNDNAKIIYGPLIYESILHKNTYFLILSTEN